MYSISRGQIEPTRRRTAPSRSGRSARVKARSRAVTPRLTRAGRGRSASFARSGRQAGSARHAPLQPAEPVREGADRPPRRGGGLGQAERVLDHGARGDEVAAAVLVELRELLPWPRIEFGVTLGFFPERAGGVPAGEALFPARQVEADSLRRRTGEPGVEGAAIAGQRLLEIDRLPEPAEPAHLPRRQRLAGGQGTPEPGEQPDQRKDIVAIVGENAGQRRRPSRAQIVEVERRDEAAGNVVVAHEPDHLTLERREPAVCEARGPHAPRRTQEVEVR